MTIFLFSIAIFLKQFLWSVFVPLWHFPDEQAHFAQVQNLIEENLQMVGVNLHNAGINTTSKEITQSEGYLGTFRDWAGNNLFTYHPEFNITYSDSKNGIYESTIRNFPHAWRREMVAKEATAYPSLYYRLSGIFYRLFYQESIFERVFATRLINVIFFVISIGTAFKMGKLLFPQSQSLPLTLVIMVGFHPMFSFLSAGINSYNIFNASFSVALYLSLLVIHKGLNKKYFLLLIAVLLLSIMGKVQGKLLPFIYLFPFVISFVKFKKSRSLILTLSGSTFVISLGMVVWRFITDQQILPEIAIRKDALVIPDFSFFAYLKNALRLTIAQTIPWYWGVFRWLSMTLPRPINRVINRLMVLAVIGLLIKIGMRIRKKDFSSNTLSILFLLWASGIYFFGIIFYDYLFIRTHGFSLGIQGRYFFPTIIPHMALLLIGMVSLFPWKKIQNVFEKALGIFFISIHTFTFFWLNASYYETGSWNKFFQQASQYKPVLFKTPFLEIYICLWALSMCWFLWYYLLTKEPRSGEKN